MSKSILFAILPMLFCVAVKADDDLKSMMAKLEKQPAATTAVDQEKLGQADVDALLGEETEDSEKAVAACFQRFGGGYGSYGYSNYSCYRPSYSYCYSPCYTPSYSYCAPSYNTCYSPCVTYSSSYTSCYTPSYSYTSCYSPCYSPCYTNYWGCY